MSNPTWNIQVGIYNKLNGDATLKSKITGIYDFIPDQTEYPYIVIGDMTEVPDDTFDKEGEDNTTTIHVFSKYHGNKEVLDLFDNIKTLLEKSDWTVAGYQLIGCRREFKQVLVEDNGEIRHGVIRFRIWVREN